MSHSSYYFLYCLCNCPQFSFDSRHRHHRGQFFARSLFEDLANMNSTLENRLQIYFRCFILHPHGYYYPAIWLTKHNPVPLRFLKILE